jgi:hypothetical protein
MVEAKKRLIRIGELRQILILGFKVRVVFDIQIKKQFVISIHKRRSVFNSKILLCIQNKDTSSRRISKF